jgi:RNA polymerase sigma-70 factor (ECF subfamily)
MQSSLICIIYVSAVEGNRIRRIRQNAPDSFETVALAHSNSLMRLARKLTGDASRAEDLFQDTYLKAFRAFDDFEGPSRCKAWLKRIMINTYINMYNRRKKIIFHQRGNDEITQYADSHPPGNPGRDNFSEDIILRNYVCDEIRNSLMSLSKRHRIIVILYDLVGMRYKEISALLSLPMGTVKSRLHRGRSLLKENLLQANGYVDGRRILHCSHNPVPSEQHIQNRKIRSRQTA